jgi:hypothetical protein
MAKLAHTICDRRSTSVEWRGKLQASQEAVVELVLPTEPDMADPVISRICMLSYRFPLASEVVSLLTAKCNVHLERLEAGGDIVGALSHLGRYLLLRTKLNDVGEAGDFPACVMKFAIEYDAQRELGKHWLHEEVSILNGERGTMIGQLKAKQKKGDENKLRQKLREIDGKIARITQDSQQQMSMAKIAYDLVLAFTQGSMAVRTQHALDAVTQYFTGAIKRGQHPMSLHDFTTIVEQASVQLAFQLTTMEDKELLLPGRLALRCLPKQALFLYETGFSDTRELRIRAEKLGKMLAELLPALLTDNTCGVRMGQIQKYRLWSRLAVCWLAVLGANCIGKIIEGPLNAVVRMAGAGRVPQPWRTIW